MIPLVKLTINFSSNEEVVIIFSWSKRAAIPSHVMGERHLSHSPTTSYNQPIDHTNCTSLKLFQKLYKEYITVEHLGFENERLWGISKLNLSSNYKLTARED